jgi:excisionase family DNA binding protein
MKDVLTTGQVAKLCNVTIRTVIKWFENGHLEGYRIPGSRDRRFAKGKVIGFMREHGFPLGGLEEDHSSKKRVLIVDDEDVVLTLLDDYLQSLGLFETDTASNGYEAGLKTQSFRPHLLIIDYNLGDVTGAQVAASIRENDKLKDTRILVMSGFLSDAEAKGVLEKGVDAFLRKPFEMETVRDEVFQLLGVV